MEELLKQIIKLPQLILSDKAWGILALYFSPLKPKSHSKINNMLPQLISNHPDEFQNTSLEQLKSFFKQWLVIAKSIGELNSMIDRAWLEIFNHPLTPDHLIALSSELLPNDRKLLEEAAIKLDNASRPSIDIASYSFTSLWSAITYKLEKPEESKKEADLNYDYIHATIVSYGGIECLKKARRLIERLKAELIREVHSVVKDNDDLGYQLIYKQSGLNIKEGFNTILESIHDKQINNLSPKTKSLVTPLLSKYYVCIDLLKTLESKSKPIDKMYIFHKKARAYSPLLPTDDLSFFQSIGISSIDNPHELNFVKFSQSFSRWVVKHVEPLFEIEEKKAQKLSPKHDR